MPPPSHNSDRDSDHHEDHAETFRISDPIRMPSEHDGEVNETRPRRKKKKKRESDKASDPRDRLGRFEKQLVSNENWWMLPTALIVLGVIFCAVGAFGISASAKNSSHAVNSAFVLLLAFVQIIVAIPIIVTALVIVGSVLGIEYGTPVQAIVNIAAIGVFPLGLDWILMAIGLGGTLHHAVGGIVCLGLMMKLFQLDLWETLVSAVCIRIVVAISFFAINLFLITR